MAVNKKVIAERKAKYGDNFQEIADLWSNQMSVQEHGRSGTIYFTPRSVALYMADLKRVRIANIDRELAKFPNPNKAIELYSARDDSITDRDNYMWIYEHYEEYKEL